MKSPIISLDYITHFEDVSNKTSFYRQLVLMKTNRHINLTRTQTEQS